jgi:hypothetical protein
MKKVEEGDSYGALLIPKQDSLEVLASSKNSIQKMLLE